MSAKYVALEISQLVSAEIISTRILALIIYCKFQISIIKTFHETKWLSVVFHVPLTFDPKPHSTLLANLDMYGEA